MWTRASGLALFSVVACHTPPAHPPVSNAPPPSSTPEQTSTATPNIEPPPTSPKPTSAGSPACPEPTSALETTLPDAEAVIDKLKKSFASCARDGRGASTELTWVVPPKGATSMLTDPEPELYELCLIGKAKAVVFSKKATRTVRVHASIRVESNGDVTTSVTQAPEGKAVVCGIVTTGATSAGTREKALELADSFTVCYARAQESDPSQSGKLRFELDLKPDGTVGDNRGEGARHTDLVRDCATATARLARFPQPTGPATVAFDVRFSVE